MASSAPVRSTVSGADPAWRMPCGDWSGDETLGACLTQCALRSHSIDPPLLNSNSDGSGVPELASTRALSQRRADWILSSRSVGAPHCADDARCSPPRAAARVLLRPAVGGAPVNVVTRVGGGGVRERMGCAEPHVPLRGTGCRRAGTDALSESALCEGPVAGKMEPSKTDRRDELGDPRDELGRHDMRRGISRRHGSGVEGAVKTPGGCCSVPAIGRSDLAPCTHTAGSVATLVHRGEAGDLKPSLRFTFVAEARSRSDRVGAKGSRRRLIRIAGHRRGGLGLVLRLRILARTQHRMQRSPIREEKDTVRIMVTLMERPLPWGVAPLCPVGSTQQISHPRSVRAWSETHFRVPLAATTPAGHASPEMRSPLIKI